MRLAKWLKFYCPGCRLFTAHNYRPDLQGEQGLCWKCDRCKHVQELSHAQAGRGQHV